MSEAQHIGWGMLVDYFAGELESTEQASVESHVFDCDDCGALYVEAASITVRVRRATAKGLALAVIDQGTIERLLAGGLSIQEAAVRPGVGLNVAVEPDTELMIGRIRGEFPARVDVEFDMGDFGVDREEDVVLADRSQVIVACTLHLGAAPGSRWGPTICRVRAAGRDEVLAEYELSFQLPP